MGCERGLKLFFAHSIFSRIQRPHLIRENLRHKRNVLCPNLATFFFTKVYSTLVIWDRTPKLEKAFSCISCLGTYSACAVKRRPAKALKNRKPTLLNFITKRKGSQRGPQCQKCIHERYTFSC